MERVSTLGMSREDWLIARKGGIGGSDAAAVMGLNPYKSPVELFFEKVSDEPPEEEQSEAAYWGTVLEEPIARRYAELHPEVRVRRNNHILVHPEHKFLFANLDREVHTDDGETYGLEIKTASLNNAKKWEDGDVPIWYALQCQHYMNVTGWKKFVIAALIGGQTYVEREIPRDDDIIANLTAAEADFWRGVVDGRPPQWDGSKSAWDILRELYPKSAPGKEIELPPSLSVDIAMYQALNDQIKAAREAQKDTEKQLDAVKQKIAAAMGDAETGVLGEYKVSYKSVSVPEKVVRAYSYRRMTIKEFAA